jgi:hypothetical protein
MLAPIPPNRLGLIRSASGFGPISGGLNLPPPGILGISLPPSALAFLIKSLNLSMSPEGGLPLSAPVLHLGGGSSSGPVWHIGRRASWTSSRSSFYRVPREFLSVGMTFLSLLHEKLLMVPPPVPSGGQEVSPQQFHVRSYQLVEQLRPFAS